MASFIHPISSYLDLDQLNFAKNKGKGGSGKYIESKSMNFDI